ncbi:MAG: hypothetical protein HOE90_02055 [Bacteriovoracaceae bacterium]|jgi:hypothetical protein|nr:hypothetical protein [Bacteriovoracaceae bacterium]
MKKSTIFVKTLLLATICNAHAETSLELRQKILTLPNVAHMRQAFKEARTPKESDLELGKFWICSDINSFIFLSGNESDWRSENRAYYSFARDIQFSLPENLAERLDNIGEDPELASNENVIFSDNFAGGHVPMYFTEKGLFMEVYPIAAASYLKVTKDGDLVGERVQTEEVADRAYVEGLPSISAPHLLATSYIFCSKDQLENE